MNINKIIMLVSVFALIGGLTSCTSMMEGLGYHKTPSPVVYECQQASILISNLTVPPASRHYLLPDNRLCYFNIPAPKKHTFTQWMKNTWSNIKNAFNS